MAQLGNRLLLGLKLLGLSGTVRADSVLTGRRDSLHISGVPRVLWCGDSSQMGFTAMLEGSGGKAGAEKCRERCGVGFERPRGQNKAERQEGFSEKRGFDLKS